MASEKITAIIDEIKGMYTDISRLEEHIEVNIEQEK